MRLTCYAHDIGPARNLAMIAAAAIHQAHRVAFIGNDERDGRLSLDPPPDAILTGLSLFRNLEELALGQDAVELGVPWVVVADVHDSWARPAAAGRVGQAVLLVASPVEIDEAKAFGYGRVEYLGGPPVWQEYQSIKPAKIQRRDPMSKLVLIGGIKDAAITDRMLEVVTQGCRAFYLEGWEFIFKPHPNEDKATADPERRARILGGLIFIETPARTTNLIPSVDLTVLTGGATDTIAAAYLRAPIIFYEDEDVRTQNAQQFSKPTWFPAEAGTCLKADESNIVQTIATLLFKEGAEALRQRQEEVYPLPPKDEAVEQRILKFLSELTGKK